MDEKQLEEIWEKMLQVTLEKFIEENIGANRDDGEFSCFGTGDNHPWCLACLKKEDC